MGYREGIRHLENEVRRVLTADNLGRRHYRHAILVLKSVT